MKARGFLFGSALLCLLSANGAYADGAYQRTKDQRTFVWNPDPKPEDAATWSGERDKEDYATGYGTLTWYKVERKYGMGSRYSVEKDIPVIRYSGRMVQGKLEGLVVATDAEGKTSHATFAGGSRSEEWSTGKGPGGTDIAPEQPKPASAKSSIPQEEARQDVAEHSAADLSLQKFSSKPQHSPPARSSDQPVDGRAADRATMELQVEAFSPEPTPIPERPARKRIAHQPAIEAPAEGPPTTESPAPSPIPEERAGNNEPVANQGATPTRGRATDLLQSLALPPNSSALKSILVAATLPRSAPLPSPSSPDVSPQGSVPPPASSPPAGPRLTTAEVIGLADDEARMQGYDLGGYQCSKVDYTVIDGTWSVWYDQKRVDGMAEAGTQFRVTVEDKTKKTSIAPAK